MLDVEDLLCLHRRATTMFVYHEFKVIVYDMKVMVVYYIYSRILPAIHHTSSWFEVLTISVRLRLRIAL